MVSPEQGQKIPETATEAQVSSVEPTETSLDIPQIVTTNGMDNHVIENEETFHGDKSVLASQEISSDTLHQPGEVYTV